LLLLYKTAPRAHPAFRYVWAPALIVSLLLQALQWGFLAYAKNFMNFNVIYGAFGGAIALLMWIYLSGSVIIFGGCLSAAIAQVEGKSAVEASDET
jgi:YihY family inner membrane protein